MLIQEVSPLFHCLAQLLFKVSSLAVSSTASMHLSPDEVVAFFDP
jgi:hypothetical protein